MRAFFTIFAIVSNLLLADALTKELAAAYLKNAAAVVVIPGFFNLAYVENRGCAWGMLQNRVWLLSAIGIVALCVIAWRRKEIFFCGVRTWQKRCGMVAEWLLYAGITGNLTDRVFRGCVIDFLDFHWGVHHFPCFNLADTYISIAAALIMILSFRQKERS